MRAVDVDHIERDRDPRRAPRLGNELVGHQVRRHLIENPRHLERQRDLAPEHARSLKRHGCDLRGRRPVFAEDFSACGSIGASASLSARRVGKWRYSVERPTPAAAAISDMLTCRSLASVAAASRIRRRLSAASARRNAGSLPSASADRAALVKTRTDVESHSTPLI